MIMTTGSRAGASGSDAESEERSQRSSTYRVANTAVVDNNLCEVVIGKLVVWDIVYCNNDSA